MGKRFRSLSNSEFESVVVKSMTCIFFDQKSVARILKIQQSLGPNLEALYKNLCS
jgi:hypothetical protein